MKNISLFILAFTFSSCALFSYNTRQNHKYADLAQVYSDSSQCASVCHKKDLSDNYQRIAATYMDSANKYYLLGHPHAFDFVDYKPKCNCK